MDGQNVFLGFGLLNVPPIVRQVFRILQNSNVNWIVKQILGVLCIISVLNILLQYA